MISLLAFLRLVYTLSRYLNTHFTVPLLFFRMLFAGGGANKSGYSNGAFVFDLNCEISYGIFVNGSAKRSKNRQKKNDFVSIINLRKE